jgi:NADPH:quinone reductase-like Zn-dependent oxidoreductase
MARAWRYNRRGLPRDVLTLDSIPIPALPPPNIRNNSAYLQQPWVLVKVSHVSLNPGCTTVMSAIPAFVRARTAIAEAEFAGTVQRVWTPESPAADDADVDAPSSSKFQIGDAVFGMIPSGLGFAGVGALATHVAMPEELVLRRPEGVAPEYACGMSFTGLTALQMAVDAKLKEGDRVLVNAASGGVGTMAVQLVRNIVGTDGVVVGICSGKNAEMVRGLGADEVCMHSRVRGEQLHGPCSDSSVIGLRLYRA